MKIYLVGGAVRDKILKLKVKDKDWVVVGATQKNMLDLGYQKVGNDFPVFIHPISKEEYALARTERKINKGHKGFSVETNINITIENDLMRRDLTINAIAQDKSGKYIDPYGGLKDIKLKKIKHVSNSFIEDPLRVLRVARFAAYLNHLNFNVAKETILLMKAMVKRGDLYQLTPERIWQETKKAMQSICPHIYFYILHKCRVLYTLFSELTSSKLNLIIFNKIILNIIKKTAFFSSIIFNYKIRFSFILYNFIIDFSQLSKSNYKNNLLFLKKLCKKFAIPNYIRDLILLSLKCNNFIQNSKENKENNIITILDYIDAWRKPYRIKQISQINFTNNLDEKSKKLNFYFKEKFFFNAYQISVNINVQNIIKKGFKGIEIKNEIKKQRIKKLKKYFSNV